MSVGIAILLNSSLAHEIINHGMTIRCKIQIFNLKILDFESLAMINVYGVWESKDKTLMWKKIMKVNIEPTHHIVRGDFNHLVKIDQIRSVGEWLSRKKVTFSNIKVGCTSLV